MQEQSDRQKMCYCIPHAILLKVVNTYKWFYWHVPIFIRFNKAVLVTFRSSRVSSWNVPGRRTVFFDKISLISSLEQVRMSKKLQHCNRITCFCENSVSIWNGFFNQAELYNKVAVLYQEMKYTHRKQSCSTHFADDSANTNKSDTLWWKHCTGRTTGENKPSSISPESRFSNPLAAFGSQCRFHFLAASKAKMCICAIDGDFCCCLCKRRAAEGRFTVSLCNRI